MHTKQELLKKTTVLNREIFNSHATLLFGRANDVPCDLAISTGTTALTRLEESMSSLVNGLYNAFGKKNGSHHVGGEGGEDSVN